MIQSRLIDVLISTGTPDTHNRKGIIKRMARCELGGQRNASLPIDHFVATAEPLYRTRKFSQERFM